MAHEEKVPWELVEEILSRVPPKSLVRFRIVCKGWNALFDDKVFIKNYKTTYQFILMTKSKVYSVNVNPEIEVSELTLDIPGLESQTPTNLVDGNEFVICNMENGSVVWNPSLRQSAWFEGTGMRLRGLGYENKNYKMFASFQNEDPTKTLWKIYDFASGAWIDYISGSSGNTAGPKPGTCTLINASASLNGTLNWVGYFDMANDCWRETILEM